ncbi:efflux RND transporter periplasmic adaptor subunit [Parafilimonas sp.]|uniref:efflux RND transporter periplasmic adaptor subunit n=1 Tax=Parafilimonas sp. TaxID=1969739 RepID=UPI0039E593E4
MHIVKHITVATALMALASCGSEKTGNTLADKKARLEQLKKQQEDINKQVASLQAEIIKLDPSANPEKAKLVAIKKLSTEDFQHYINLQGKIDAENIAYVTPRNQGGQVKAVYVKQGDVVRKGQLLLKLDDAVLKTQLNNAETQLKYAQDIYQRRSNLWKENIGTEVELTTAKNNVDQAQHQVDLMKEQLGYTNVYAEMNGIAEEVTIRVGETFTGNPATGSYIKLVNTGDLKATAQVPDNYLEKVKTGSTVKIILPDINDTIISKISVAGKVIDPNNRTFQIEARLPSNASFKPNQLAFVRIMDYAASNTFTVPVNTLQTDEQGKYVLVAVNENGKMYARKKHVEVGQLYEDQLEVKSGLAVGDMLITDGFQNLYDGQLITISAS